MKQLLYLVAAFLAGYISATVATCCAEREGEVPTATTVTRYDTIPYYYPIARDSVVVRYETRRLPVAQRDTVVIIDSVKVMVPITQKEYQDSAYHLWISGYAANLDSIHTFSRHEYTTTQTPPAKPKRWHLGITAGLAITPKGLQPYIGGGITYSFKSF